MSLVTSLFEIVLRLLQAIAKVATSSLKFLVSCGFKTKKAPKAAFEPNVPKTWRLSNFQLVQHHTEEVPTGEITTKQLVMSCSIDCTGVWASGVI